MEIDLEKEYNDIRKKYSRLPSFNEINVDFELSVFEPRIANNTLFARYLRKVCGSYLENFCGFLTNLLNPNPAFLLGMNESKFLDDEDKKMITLVIQQNMVLVRWASATTSIYKEENEIEAILKFHVQMKKNKETLKTVFGKLKEGWEKMQSAKEEQGHYFG